MPAGLDRQAVGGAAGHGSSAARLAPEYLLLTDADIAHAPDNLRRSGGAGRGRRLGLVSLMAQAALRELRRAIADPRLRLFLRDALPVRLGERSAEAARRPRRAAACWCAPTALEAAGGIEAIRGAIIDDCALARRMKAQGPIWLGLTERARQPAALSAPSGTSAGWCRARPMRSSDYSPLMLVGAVAGHGASSICVAAGWRCARRRRWRAVRRARLGADDRELPADAPLLSPLAALGRWRCR